MMRRAACLGFVIALLVALAPLSPAQAADPTNRGLFISPLRSYLALEAGEQKTRSFTVANLTDQPIVITLHVEQFSVADYAYDYRFSQPDNDWIRLIENRLELQPNESHDVAYTISIPADIAPGGHYYTILASADLSQAGLGGTVRAATLLYITINGALVKTSELFQASLPHLVISPQIPYTFEVKNTGNTHYFAYFSGSLRGLFYNSTPAGTSQLLMPDTIKRISGTIPSPPLPGIYRATYGYTTDDGQTISRSHYLVFAPPWFLAFSLILAIGAYHLWQRRQRRSSQQKTPKKPTGS